MRLAVVRLLAIPLLALAAAPAWAHGPRRVDLGMAPAEMPADVVVVPLPLARPVEFPARFGPIPSRIPAGRSAVDLAEVAGVLIVTLGLAGFGRSWQRDRRIAVATVTAALVLGFIVETTPHLVHHALDRDRGADCQGLQAAERNQGTVGVLDLTPAPVLARLIDAPPLATVPDLAVPAPHERAPPA